MLNSHLFVHCRLLWFSIQGNIIQINVCRKCKSIFVEIFGVCMLDCVRMSSSILIGWIRYMLRYVYSRMLWFSRIDYGWLCYWWWWWCDGSLSIRMNIVQVFFVVFSVSVPSFYRILLFFDTTQITTQRVHFLNKNKWSVFISYVCMVCMF